MNTKVIKLFLLILSIVGAGCLKSYRETKKTGIEGKIVYYGQPLKGAYVYAYRDLDSDSYLHPSFISVPSRDDGRYDFEIPPGTYYILAKMGDCFSYFSGNPIVVRENEYSWIGLNCIKVKDDDLVISENADIKETFLKGCVTYQDIPLENAYVYVYLDRETDFKGQGFQRSLPTDKDGRFQFVDLPEGEYYLIARKRNSPDPSGPIQVGDYSAYFNFNPVHVRRGKIVEANIKCVVRASEICEETLSMRSGETIICGKILDSRCLPMKEMYAFLYETSIMGHERPVYISNITDESGIYEIRLKNGGKYYIGARQTFGDSPRPGELYGLYEGSIDHSVIIKAGELKEKLDIYVQPILE